MAYTALAGVIILGAIVIVFIAGRLLIKGSWFVGWLKGMTGLGLLVIAVILALSGLDFYSYKQLSKEQNIANLSFTRTASQQYTVSLVDDNGIEQVFNLKGDLWQLDARIIKWNRVLAGLGLPPGYRLDRLSGRYFSLEKEHSAERSIHQLDNSDSIIDVWQWLRRHGRSLSLIDADYGSATYLPMSDGALYSVSLSSSGLLARPLNEPAQAAITGWE